MKAVARVEREAYERMLQQLPERLRPIYDSLPQVECKGLCHACCGPINWGKHEAALAEKRSGKAALFVQHGNDIRCIYLHEETKRCEVYDIRPLVCRLYGVVKAMKCEHGCAPAEWLPDEEARRLLREVAPIVGDFIPPRASQSVEPWIRDYYERVAQMAAEQGRRDRGETGRADGSNPLTSGGSNPSGPTTPL